MNAQFLRHVGLLLAAVLLAACGGSEPAIDAADDMPGSAPQSTVFDPLTTAPGRVEQRLDADREGHERALDDQIEASEGVAAGSTSAP